MDLSNLTKKQQGERRPFITIVGDAPKKKKKYVWVDAKKGDEQGCITILLRKTHEEACIDGSIDTLSLNDVRQLVGYVEPSKREWTVTMREGFYRTTSQDVAEIISRTEQVLFLLLRDNIRRN